MCYENGVGFDGFYFFDIYWIFIKDGEVFIYLFILLINFKILVNIFIYCYLIK